MVVLNKRSKWSIKSHFEAEKPLKYACPYAGCLRGANSSEEIEDHILRHHDITDPTKPREERKEQKGHQREARKEKVGDVEVLGVPFLSQSEKRKISKVWHESKAKGIDRKNQRNLIKHFVSAIVDDDLDKFDKTTKRLQREYMVNLQRMAAQEPPRNVHGQLINQPVHHRVPRVVPQDLPPPLDDEAMNDDIDFGDGPRSLWH